jgi:hypothetical protein
VEQKHSTRNNNSEQENDITSTSERTEETSLDLEQVLKK